MKQFIHIGAGRNRIVYRRGSIVIKIPLNEHGVYDNWHERTVFKTYGKRGEIPYARCRMWKNNILVMEYIEHTGRRFEGCPVWADYVDGGQVGTDRNGNLVAYDYGIM